MNILFTSVGRRTYLVEYFKNALKNDGKVYVANSDANSPAFLVADESVVSPLIYDKNYIPFLLEFCKKNNIQIMAWGPLLRGNMEDPRIMKIASKYQKSPAQLLIRWNIQQGIIPIPKSKNPSRLLENISVFDFDISLDDIHELNQMNQNMRTSYNPLEFDF